MHLSRFLGKAKFALVGILAVIAGMAMGHLVAGLVQPAASPVLAVGSNVIDATPTSIKTWAIRRFGTADKAVLLSTVTVVALILAVAAGIFSRRRRNLALGLIGVLGVVVIAAAYRSPSTASGGSVPGARVWPGLTAMLVSGAVLVLLARFAAAGEPAEVASAESHESPLDHSAEGSFFGSTPRRRFLGVAVGVAGASVVAGSVGQRLARPEPVAALDGLTPDLPAPALPTGLDAKVPGISPFRTASRDFYRVDTALVVPRVDRDSWRLVVDGDVDKRLELTFEDLIKFPIVERDLTLNCVSNEVGGPYISSGRWLGVRTRDVLERAGVSPKADQVMSRSTDGMTISTPIKALTDDRDSIIAIGLNGEALPRKRGYPARLITPGLYGFVGATKWLKQLTVTTYEKSSAYWTDRGWAIDGTVKTQSRIDTPGGFDRVALGKVMVGGVAWAQRRGIEKVEIQIDNGPWQPVILGPEANIDYWRQWYFEWDVTAAGRHDLRVRATDGDGVVQTTDRVPPFPNGASGLASISVNAA